MNIRNIIIHNEKGDLHDHTLTNGKTIKTRDYLLATVIYEDGTCEEVSFNEGINKAVKLAKKENLTAEEMKDFGIVRYVKEEDYIEALDDVIDEMDDELEIDTDELDFDDDFDDEDIEVKRVSSENDHKTAKTIGRLALGAGILALILGSCSLTKGLVKNSTEPIKAEEPDDEDFAKDFEDMTIEELLETTTNDVQKEAMNRRFNVINYLNGEFADYYLESDKDVRFGLHYRELEALDLAYNNYTTEEVMEMYNGSTLNIKKLNDAYRTGTLMMMGAYTMSDSNMPIKGYELIRCPEKREIAKSWEDKFYAIKNAKGQDQINKINDFYREFNGLFPIDQKTRTEGLAHYDSRENMDYELLAYLTPMVSAMEQMYQNLEVDATLSDQAIKFVNDLGVCNYLDDKIENYARCVNTCNDCQKSIDESYPTGLHFENAINAYLESKNINVIDDDHRDISKYDRYLKAVNAYCEAGKDGYTENQKYVSISKTLQSWCKSSSKTTYRTETKRRKVSREEAVKKFGEAKVKAKEEAVRKQIEKENAAAKAKALKEAAKKKKELQDAENKKKEQLEKEIKKENEQNKQDVIDNLPDYVDKDSVSPDPGHSSDLPDPQESGKRLDNNEPEYKGKDRVTPDQIMPVEPNQVHNNTSSNTNTTPANNSTTYDDLPDPNETGKDFDAKAEAMVNAMANAKSEESPKTLTK